MNKFNLWEQGEYNAWGNPWMDLCLIWGSCGTSSCFMLGYTPGMCPTCGSYISSPYLLSTVWEGIGSSLFYSMILKQSEVACAYPLLFPPIRVHSVSFLKFLMEKNCLTTTLMGGNIQRSDDVKNKPSNKEHETERGGSDRSDLALSENQAICFTNKCERQPKNLIMNLTCSITVWFLSIRDVCY